MNSKDRLYMRFYVSLMAHRTMFIKTGFIPLQENIQPFYLFIFANEATHLVEVSFDLHRKNFSRT